MPRAAGLRTRRLTRPGPADVSLAALLLIAAGVLGVSLTLWAMIP